MATKTHSITTNQAFTTLNGALTNSATSMPVASGGVALLGLTGLASPNFTWLKLTQTPTSTPEIFEIVLATSVSGDTITVTRAQDGTSGVAFDDGEPVEITVVNAMYQDLVDTLTDGTAEIAVGALIKSNGIVITDSAGKLDHASGDDEIVDTVAITLADNVIVSGGGVSWTGTGLVFDVAAIEYWIDGVRYTRPATTVTLDAEHASLDRIDLVIVDDTPLITKITGTAAATPVEPVIDATTQLKLVAITVNDSGGGGGPAITIEDIYLEDAGTPAEWAATASDGSHVVNSTNDANNGTKSVEATSADNGDSVSFVDAAAFDLSTFGTISFYVKPKASWVAAKRILGSFWLGGVSVSNTVIFAKDTEPDFDSTSNTWQQLIRNIFDFGLTNTSPDEFRIEVSGGGAAIGYFLDDITMETTPAPVVVAPHTIDSHIDTSATGAELNDLTDDSMVDDLHRHSELSASDGTPNPCLSADAAGDMTFTNAVIVDGLITAGSSSTVLTTAAGLLRHQSIDPSIAGTGVTVSSGVLSLGNVAELADTTATGAELETLTDGSDASALHVHTIVSLDTTATGAELTTLTDGSNADALHVHAALATLTLSGTLFITEQAGASADVVGDGQFWVKTAIPNEPWFTDDASKDRQLLQGGGGTLFDETILVADGTTGGLLKTTLAVLTVAGALSGITTLDTTGDATFATGDVFIPGGTLAVGIAVVESGYLVHLNAATGGSLIMQRTDGSVSGNNAIGQIDFFGDIDAVEEMVGRFACQADGTWGTDDSPTKLVWYTTPASAQAGVEVMRLTSTGRLGILAATPLGQLHVDQSSTSGAIPVLVLDQADIDHIFLNLIGTSAADSTRSISSSTAEAAAKFGAYMVGINGTTKWVRVYDSAV